MFFVIDNLPHEGGCYIETRGATGEVFLVHEHPQVTRLEALIKAAGLQAFDHTHLPAGTTIYHPSARYRIDPLPRMPAPPPPPAN